MPHARTQAAGPLRCALVSLAVSLSACASMDEPPASAPSEVIAAQAAASGPAPARETPPPVTGQWEGRLSLKLGAFGREPGNGSQMGFELDVKNDQGTLSLSTPLGTRMAMVRWQAPASGEATLKAQLQTSEGTQAFASLEDLTQQLLGEALPLQAMLHWLQGHPAPDLPFEAPAGQKSSASHTFVQAGWQVDASELSHGRLNAKREATATHRSVTLRLRLDL